MKLNEFFDGETFFYYWAMFVTAWAIGGILLGVIALNYLTQYHDECIASHNVSLSTIQRSDGEIYNANLDYVALLKDEVVIGYYNKKVCDKYSLVRDADGTN